MELVQRWPVLGRHEMAAAWLRIWVDLGRAPRTIDAYARGLAEYLEMCERVGVDPLTASRAHVAVYVRELTQRPGRMGVNVVSLESGSGLANATVQQRLVPVRLFYDFLMEEGCAGPTRSGADDTRRDARSVAGRGGWCHGRRNCRGFQPMSSGCPFWTLCGPNRHAHE
jgi:site-specific recombinase XerD